MARKVRDRQLVLMALFILCYWVFSTFAAIAIWYIKGGLRVPKSDVVARQAYASLLELARCLIFTVIPCFSLGYLVFGLWLLWVVWRARANEDTKPVA